MPELSERPGRLICNWESDRITITCRYLRERDRQVKGEIIITTAIPGIKSPILTTDYNFSSAQTRSKLAKELEELVALPTVNWRLLLEQLSELVPARFRAGEPMVELMLGGKPQPPKWLLEPLLQENQPTVLFGEGGSGKSTLVKGLAICLSLGWIDNPLGIAVLDDRYKIAYLDWEADSVASAWQHTALLAGFGLPVSPLLYRRCSRPLADDIDAVQHWIGEFQTNIVIVDSLALAAGGELNSSETATRFFEALRSLKQSAFIIAHQAKDPNVKRKTIYGNVFFTNLARCVWQVTKSQERGRDQPLYLRLDDEKHNYSSQYEPLGFKLTYGPERDWIRIESTDADAVKERREEQGYTPAIIQALKEAGKLSTKDLVAQVGGNPQSLRQVLYRLKGKGIIVSVPSGGKDAYWGLPALEV